MGFDFLANRIPLHEAAAFFVKLKTAEEVAPVVAPSPEVAEEEAAPEQGDGLAAQLAQMVQTELKTHYAYITYANTLRDLAHHAIAEEFLAHADHETDHAEYLLRKLSVLGPAPTLPDIPPPEPLNDPVQIIQTMIAMEEEGIEGWMQLRDMVGEGPTQFKIEELLTEEEEHLDELKQLLPEDAAPLEAPVDPAAAAAPVEEAPAEAAPPAAPGGAAPPVSVKVGFARALDELSKTAVSAQWVAQHARKGVKDRMKNPTEIGHGLMDRAAEHLGRAKNEPFASHRLKRSVLGQTIKDTVKDVATTKTAISHYAIEKAVRRSRAPASRLAAFEEKMHATAKRLDGLPGVKGSVGRKADHAGQRASDKLENIDARNTLSKQAGVSIELFRPGTMHYHGDAMKLALANMKPTVFVPEMDLEGNLKTASVRMRKVATGMGMPAMPSPSPVTLPDTGQGKQQMPAVATPTAPTPMAPKMAAMLFKRALDELAPPPPMAGGEEDAELQQYLAEEQENASAQQEVEGSFYRQRFEETNQQLQAMQQEKGELEQHVAQLTDQVSQTSQMQQQAMAQAQQIQDSAMQQAQQANAAAQGAMQKTLASQNELIQQQQLAVSMRDAVHNMRTQLMGLVQTELPPATTMEAGVSGAAAQQAADLDAQAMAAAQDPNNPQAAQDPNAAMAGGDPNAAAAAQGGQQAPAQAAPQEQAAPAPPPPQGGAGGGEAGGDAPKDASKGEGGKSVSLKVGHVKQAKLSDRAIGALAGGAIGAGSSLVEGQLGNDNLRLKVKKLEAEDRAEGGFGNAMNLAQARLRLTLGEMSERHPLPAAAIAGVSGAMTGAATAPYARQLAKSLRGA